MFVEKSKEWGINCWRIFYNDGSSKNENWLLSIQCEEVLYEKRFLLKLGLHEPQQQVERSVTLVSSIAVERLRCALQVSSVA